MEYTTSSALDFQDAQVRAVWAAVVPAVLVSLFCLASVPIPLPQAVRTAIDALKAPFRSFLTLQEAEALDADTIDAKPGPPVETTPLWRAVVLSGIALFEVLVWVAIGCFSFSTNENVWSGVLDILIAISWLYAAARPIVRPVPTPPYDLLVLYLVHVVGGALILGGALFDHQLGVPMPSTARVVGMTLNLLAVLAVLGVVLAMPLAIPSAKVAPEAIGVTVSPDDYTTLFEWLTLSWIWPLIKLGTNTTLNENDVWNLSPAIRSRPVFIKFSSMKHSRLLWQLWATNSLDVLLDSSLSVVSVLLGFASPFFLNRILEAINVPNPGSRSRAYVYAFLSFICMLLNTECDLYRLWHNRRVATRMRIELMAAIYDKALKRKDYSGIVDAKKADGTKDDTKSGADIGKIVNLMAGDATRVSMSISAMQLTYIGIPKVIVGTIFLYKLLGWSTFAGYFVFLVCWPFNKWVAKRAIKIQKGLFSARDKRMGVINELISAIKFIKFFAWEESWIGRALDVREVELGWINKARMNMVLFSLLYTAGPLLVSVVAFFAFVSQGNELTVPIAFTSITLFAMIKEPLNEMPDYIIQILQTLLAVERIGAFLDEDEVTEQVSSLKRDKVTAYTSVADDEGLGIQNGSFKWNEVERPQNGKDAAAEAQPEYRRFTLEDISIVFPEGKLTCVTGPTASGKTALLLALLGEMTLTQGRLIMSKDTSRIDEFGLMHAISYAAQSPWLRHQSIKDNILFGYPYDEQRYNDVVDCCALQPDLDMLEDGDNTEIGARGVNLSGGQKARVALARAVYARTKYVLLDDPLSAVDSHTARWLFEKLLCGPLLANRTVVLVTHHVELVLPGTYYICRMLDGRIDSQGSVQDLRSEGVLDDIAHDSAAVNDDHEATDLDEETSPTADVLDKPAEEVKKPRKFIEDERRETGGVKWSMYKGKIDLFRSYWTWAILILVMILTEVLGVAEKLWIKTWGEAYRLEKTSMASYLSPSFRQEKSLSSGLYHAQGPSSVTIEAIPRAQDHSLFYIGIYMAIAALAAIASVVAVITQYTGALRASRIMFKQLLVGVVRATMRWHDVTPQGALNRFGKDIETIDQSLAMSLRWMTLSVTSLLAALLTVTVVFPLFLIPAFFIGYAYWKLAIGYLRTGTDLRRMESNSRSPIFSGFSELLEGIVTVRAFSAERRFLDEIHAKIDAMTKQCSCNSWTFWMTNRWLSLNSDVLGAVAVYVTTLFALSGFVSAGIAGLSITSATTFTISIFSACRFWTNLELDLNSVERLVEYLDLPQEPPAIIESNRPPAYWPSSTSSTPLLVAEDLVVKYAPDLPAVLHGVSFALNARERVGVLGRTGSGKSTLAMSILRFVDPAGGRILIDGIDISTIGVHDLRSRITFIPQDATLFSGTWRDNLDPFGEHDDSECIDALRRVHLFNTSSPAPSSLNIDPSPSSANTNTSPSSTPSPSTPVSLSLSTPISPGGLNFSQGQRQLLALARALLRRSAIVILDEATSSIDFAADVRVQAAVREEFGGSLLVTVAHRIRTVIDYDRLIVLDKGRIAEFDTPYNLIRKAGGVFRGMCLQSGTFDELEAAAKAGSRAASD
ncbi:hypothetical protein PLICRDRAFT_119100 [Plicaturopsis crispa FD-325 SS-3]|uniref:Multidrug resistance-associated ABC transporter n=1 Tax=Plicaturopsis crispa FD-325 SS-3 TaxID=944288 RepID=A0A0C9SWK1_PLICR|nr:hypothetical protein PLICRDRAFT_119100 [Plicaturopsis crispa FD-325 SS-3]